MDLHLEHLYLQARKHIILAELDIYKMNTSSQYRFLAHPSFIDCSQFFAFKAEELRPIQKMQDNTKNEIKRVIAESKLFAPFFKKLIT